jgi:Tfp pilus assembly protein PilV
MTSRSRPAARGITLVEVMITFLVLTVGLAAISRLQAHLRLSAEVARQRAEAVRLAQADMERLRAFAQAGPAAGPDVAPAAGSYAAIASRAAAGVEAAAAHTAYTLEHSVAAHAEPRYKAIAVTARWADRFGDPQHVELASMVAGIDPALGGLLSLHRAPPGPVLPHGRHPAIPAVARDLGDGRSAFRPAPGAGVVWVFDNATGVITSVCNAPPGVADADLSAAQLAGCTTRLGLLVSGFVRFATTSDTPDAQDAEQPRGAAMDLDLCLSAADAPQCTGDALAECFDDAPASTGAATRAATLVTYHCAVFPPAGRPHWSGRLNVVPQGWLVAAAEAAEGGFNVCRYSFDHNANGRIDNPEHPALYTQVAAPLPNQNFLVVRGVAACPPDRPVSIGTASPDNVANDSTVQHQP